MPRCFWYSCLQLSPPAPAEMSRLLPGHHLPSCLHSFPPTPALCSTHCIVQFQTNACGKRGNASAQEHLPSFHAETQWAPTTSADSHPLPAWSSCTNNTLRPFPCSLLLSWDRNLHSMMFLLLIILSVFPVSWAPYMLAEVYFILQQAQTQQMGTTSSATCWKICIMVVL